jgi:hypothetical protein
MTGASNWFGLGSSDREGLSVSELDGVFRLKPGVSCVVDIAVSPGSLTRGGPVGVRSGNVRQTAPSVRCASTEKTVVMGGSGAVSGCR